MVNRKHYWHRHTLITDDINVLQNRTFVEFRFLYYCSWQKWEHHLFTLSQSIQLWISTRRFSIHYHIIVPPASANIHNRSCYVLQKIKLGKPETLSFITYVGGLVSSTHPDRKQWCEKLPGTLSIAPAETLINSTVSRRGRHLQCITHWLFTSLVCAPKDGREFSNTVPPIIQRDGHIVICFVLP